MFVVIFTAKINELDGEYGQMAAALRELAMSKYHCIDFCSVTENDTEIALSYWESLEDIKKWKDDPRHLEAQLKGKQKYYQDYQVEIAEIHTSRNRGADR
jgi:heme-degrading monooxygenase HmoA